MAVKRSVIFTNGMFCGSLSAIAITSLRQDWLGQEGVIASARDHWVPASISVPLALGLLLGTTLIGAATGVIARLEDARDGGEDEES